MLKWEAFSGDASEWDKTLLQARDHNIFQSYAWGQYKENSGQNVVRYLCKDLDGHTKGLIQMTIKSLPLKLKFIWSAGGPILEFPKNSADLYDEALGSLFKQLHADFPRALIRIHCHTENNASKAFAYSKTAKKPFYRLNSGFSVLFEMAKFKDFRSALSVKHRYYVKKSASNNLEWVVGSSDELLNALSSLHGEMTVAKSLESISTSLDELKKIRGHIPQNHFVLVGYQNNVPVTACLVLTFGTKAFYMIAANGQLGRKISAAYAMIERLFIELQSRGIEHFDFAGVDPVSAAAAGVNHFKSGFGGSLIEHLGEWESAQSEWQRILINGAIRLKGGRA